MAWKTDRLACGFHLLMNHEISTDTLTQFLAFVFHLAGAIFHRLTQKKQSSSGQQRYNKNQTPMYSTQSLDYVFSSPGKRYMNISNPIGLPGIKWAGILRVACWLFQTVLHRYGIPFFFVSIEEALHTIIKFPVCLTLGSCDRTWRGSHRTCGTRPMNGWSVHF